MIARQRKAHKYVWLIIAIILPVVLFLAVKDLDFSSQTNRSEADSAENASSIIRELKSDMLNMQLLENTLRIQLKQPLRSTSSLVYGVKNAERGELLGQLTGTGEYTFSTLGYIEGIVVFDPIKEVEILIVLFSESQL